VKGRRQRICRECQRAAGRASAARHGRSHWARKGRPRASVNQLSLIGSEPARP
jgi:hypothetical protein